MSQIITDGLDATQMKCSFCQELLFQNGELRNCYLSPEGGYHNKCKEKYEVQV